MFLNVVKNSTIQCAKKMIRNSPSNPIEGVNGRVRIEGVNGCRRQNLGSPPTCLISDLQSETQRCGDGTEQTGLLSSPVNYC